MLWLFVCSFLLQPASPQTAVRDAPPVNSGTAIVRGRVTDKETGLPISRVAVQILVPRPGEMFPLKAETDAEGRYELRQVPAGSYAVMATMPMYRATHLPQRYGESAALNPLSAPSGRSTKVDIPEGAVVERIDIAMSRSLALDGRVVDEFGDPMADVPFGWKAPMIRGVSFKEGCARRMTAVPSGYSGFLQATTGCVRNRMSSLLPRTRGKPP